MIVGSGNIAKVLNDRQSAIFFASGVSKSSETDFKEFMREADLLLQYANDGRCLVYFSSIVKKSNPYGDHKANMEMRVKAWFDNYCIIRLGNIDWDTNPNTFLNYMKSHPNAPVLDEYKYMISKEQLLLITDNIPLFGKHEISIFGERKKVKDFL